MRLDTATAESVLRTVVADGDTVYVAWEDRRDGAADIYVNGSSDDGTTWMASDARVDTDAPDGAFVF